MTSAFATTAAEELAHWVDSAEGQQWGPLADWSASEGNVAALQASWHWGGSSVVVSGTTLMQPDSCPDCQVLLLWVALAVEWVVA